MTLSYILVKMVISDDQLEIKIKDNGCGFDVNQISRGHGMKNYAFRAGLLQGCSKITSSEAGTEVSFSIPIKG